MKLPQFSRIITEGLPKEVLSWISLIVDPVNNFMLAIRNGLNKDVTVNDNLSGAIVTHTVQNNTIAFSYKSGRAPRVVIIGSWADLSVSTWTPTTQITLGWSYANGVITCTLYGTDTSHKYSVNFLILDD